MRVIKEEGRKDLKNIKIFESFLIYTKQRAKVCARIRPWQC